MSLQKLNGSFKPDAFRSVVLNDRTGLTQPSRSTGQVRSVQQQTAVPLAERWSVIGWSLRAQVMLLQGLAASPWGKIGNLWAGLGIDSSIPDKSPAVLPQDLTTFAKVFEGRTDDLPINPDFTTGEPIGSTFMLPAPITIESGAQLQMALIQTPSILVNQVEFIVISADYTILYDAARL